MKIYALLATACVAVALSMSSTMTRAHDYTVNDLKIDHPWARPTPGRSTVTAAYFVLENNSKLADRLVGVKADIADHAELHETVEEAGIAKMQHLSDGISVPANKSVEFKPRGKHVMLMGLQKPLADGDAFPLTLVFAERGEVEVIVKVEQPKSGADGDSGHHHH